MPVQLEYPIVLRVVKGHIEASQPDLGLYRIRGRFDEIRHREEIGTIVLDLWQEIARILTEKGPGAPPSTPSRVPLQSDQVLSTKEAGALLGVSGETIRDLCKKGRIKHHLTPGGHHRIRYSDLRG